MRRVRPTRPSVLVLIAVLLAVVSFVLVRKAYGSLPPLSYPPCLTVLVVAIVEAMLARSTRSRLLRRPNTAPVQPLQVARMVALAKASAVVGAVLLGLWSGVFAYTFALRGQLSAAADDVPVAAAGVVTALLLVGAALWLEHSCRTPALPDDQDEHDHAGDLGSRP